MDKNKFLHAVNSPLVARGHVEFQVFDSWLPKATAAFVSLASSKVKYVGSNLVHRVHSRHMQVLVGRRSASNAERVENVVPVRS
jgi:cyclophilin family peptidyl-prolyl cis-trans isomerase